MRDLDLLERRLEGGLVLSPVTETTLYVDLLGSTAGVVLNGDTLSLDASGTIVGNWQANGVDIAGATGATYTPQIGVDGIADDDVLRWVGTIDGEDAVSQSAPIRQDLAFTTSPSIGAGVLGSTITLDEGVAGPATATLTITAFTLDGVDKTGELVGLDWDSTGEQPGTLSLTVQASAYGGAKVVSETVTRELADGPATVDSVTASAIAGGQLPVTITSSDAEAGNTVYWIVDDAATTGNTAAEVSNAQTAGGSAADASGSFTWPGGDPETISLPSGLDGSYKVRVVIDNGALSNVAASDAVTIDTTAPTYSNGATDSTDGSTWTLTFSEAISGTGDPADWTLGALS